MSIKYLLFVGICLGIARHVYAVDLTLKPGETSDAVIDATVRKIRTKCILAQDSYFLRRLAEAQMNSTAATTGGIWRVTYNQLTTVKNACKNMLKANCSKVQTDFGVDVSTATMSDLEKPLHSALVMSLFILNLRTSIPVSIELQADFWKQHITSNGQKLFFRRLANKLEQRNDCASAQIDLVFLIDSSGSVEKPDFEKTKTFLKNIVYNLDISPEKTRVAVIRFADTPNVSFFLGDHNTNFAVRNAIDAIIYDGTGTATDTALDKARTSVFTNTRKSVASKVLVLVTDGKSNNENETIAAAEKLKDDGVTIFTIGVVNPKVSELIAAASEPSCTHFINLKDYNEIGFIVKEIESDSCKAPTVVQKETPLLNIAIPKTNETKQQVLQITNTTKSTLGTTVLVKVQCGVVTVYASFQNSYPNEANYDYKTSATDDQPGKLFVDQVSNLRKLVLNVLSQKRFDLSSSACSNPSYDISINPTAPKMEAACVVKQVNSPCTAKQLDSACYSTKPVTGELSQLFNNSIPKDDQIQEQVLEISNSTDSSGSTILVSSRCAEVTVYGAYNNRYPIEEDHVYKTYATHGSPGKITVKRGSHIDNLTLTILSKKQRGLNSPACDHPSYAVSIKPKDSTLEVVCHRKQDERHCTPGESESKCSTTPAVVQKHTQLRNIAIPKTKETKQEVLQITNTTKSTLGTTVMVNVQCGVVTVYASFNNSYPNEADYDDKTVATDHQPGELFFVQESEVEMFVLTVLSKKRFDLNSSACDNPSYDISINPTAPRIEAACIVKMVNSSCTAKQLDSACYNSTPVVANVSRLFNNNIPQNNQVQEQVLEISNSTHSSGSIILVKAHCSAVTVYGAFNNSYPIEIDHDYKTSARDGYSGKIFVARKSKYDNFTLTIFSKSLPNYNFSTCSHPSYSVSIMPKDPKYEVVCHRKQDERHCTPAESKAKCSKTSKTKLGCLVKHIRSRCSAKKLDATCFDPMPVTQEISKLFDNCVENDGIRERILEIGNSTDSSGSTIMVKAYCAEVSVYGAFNNRYPVENDCDYKTFAIDGKPGKLVVKKGRKDHLTLTIRFKKRFGLKFVACDHPSYTVSIKPNDQMFEVACHRKEDERPCSYKETKSKCEDDPRDEPSAGYRQLSINAWISAGLLAAWRLA
ncbi:uncharacterized protein LOC106868389 isoform X2 [Octopus bimaculoides]|uniref:uncharacterized protein LOC106868389 isoform X2 n=1 Tax=Octopus bimaculoides TaxID=37653 RepID=UPI0022E98F30|nr:uncharacterized protein LOC106868389 isoform X2 [Octopus bimaculoides]